MCLALYMQQSKLAKTYCLKVLKVLYWISITVPILMSPPVTVLQVMQRLDLVAELAARDELG